MRKRIFHGHIRATGRGLGIIKISILSIRETSPIIFGPPSLGPLVKRNNADVQYQRTADKKARLDRLNHFDISLHRQRNQIQTLLAEIPVKIRNQ